MYLPLKKKRHGTINNIATVTTTTTTVTRDIVQLQTHNLIRYDIMYYEIDRIGYKKG